jgi:hypothetical protein
MSMPHFIEHAYYYRGLGLFVEEKSSTIPPQPSTAHVVEMTAGNDGSGSTLNGERQRGTLE